MNFIFLLLMFQMAHATKLGLTLAERMTLDEPLEEPVSTCKAIEVR